MAGRIVVGVDGSERSVNALRWALDEAKRRDATVDVVHAWHYPYTGGVVPGMSYAIDFEEVEKAAREVLDRAIQHARPPRELHVEPILVQSSAARALLDTAIGADLLVVGSRGRGGFTGLLLGSVSQQCAHHAPCPVVIVPTPEDHQ